MKPYSSARTLYCVIESNKRQSVWNYLEITKLCVSLLIPITLAYIAATVNFQTSSANLRAAWLAKKMDNNLQFWRESSPILESMKSEIAKEDFGRMNAQIIRTDSEKMEDLLGRYGPYLSEVTIRALGNLRSNALLIGKDGSYANRSDLLDSVYDLTLAMAITVQCYGSILDDRSSINCEYLGKNGRPPEVRSD